MSKLNVTEKLCKLKLSIEQPTWKNYYKGERKDCHWQHLTYHFRSFYILIFTVIVFSIWLLSENGKTRFQVQLPACQTDDNTLNSNFSRNVGFKAFAFFAYLSPKSKSLSALWQRWTGLWEEVNTFCVHHFSPHHCLWQYQELWKQSPEENRKRCLTAHIASCQPNPQAKHFISSKLWTSRNLIEKMFRVQGRAQNTEIEWQKDNAQCVPNLKGKNTQKIYRLLLVSPDTKSLQTSTFSTPGLTNTLPIRYLQ